MAGYISGLLPLTSGEQTGQIIVKDEDEETLQSIMDAVSTTKQDFQEQMAKLNDDLIEANERQAAINENQANLNKRVDARLSNLELLNPPEFSPAPHVRAPFTTRKFLKQ